MGVVLQPVDDEGALRGEGTSRICRRCFGSGAARFFTPFRMTIKKMLLGMTAKGPSGMTIHRRRPRERTRAGGLGWFAGADETPTRG